MTLFKSREMCIQISEVALVHEVVQCVSKCHALSYLSM